MILNGVTILSSDSGPKISVQNYDVFIKNISRINIQFIDARSGLIINCLQRYRHPSVVRVQSI